MQHGFYARAFGTPSFVWQRSLALVQFFAVQTRSLRLGRCRKILPLAAVSQMSFQGHLVCHTCRLQFALGKLIRDEDGSQIGFGHAKFTDDELGRIALAFIGEHIKHDLVCLGDSRLHDMTDLPTYDMLMRVPPDSSFAQTHSLTQLAGIDVWRMPCEAHVDRAERIRNARGD